MEVIKKVISLEQGRSRASDASFGTLTATSFFFKIQFTQDVDDMGMFTDYAFQPAMTLNRDLTMEEKFLRLPGAEAFHWYENGGQITGFTDSKIEGLRSYNPSNPYVVNFDIERENYNNFSGTPINGVSRITNVSGDVITYTYDAKNDLNIGTLGQTTGILYEEDITSATDDVTLMRYQAEGWNMTNTQLSAIVKEEYLMGITTYPEIENDVFIDRGVVTVMESHLRMSEVESLDHLLRYGNGFYNVVRQ